ncbi:MAG: glycosyltransferase family 4 protein [Thermodesulfobacterium sp.]|nr:glycosyltransferase family 4 protein [Thermodesulfobacterium sp.]
MVERGHEVLALAPDYDDKTKERIKALGAVPIDYYLSRTGLNPFQDAYTFLQLFFLLRKLKPDVVLSYAVKPVIYGTLAAWLARVPRRFALVAGLGYVFTSTREQERVTKKLLRKLVSLLYREAFHRATRVFFQNPDDLQEFYLRGLAKREKSVLIGATGVDMKAFSPTPPVQNPVTFLLVARLLREKGIYEFVEAAKRIKSKYPNTRFLLVGGLDSNPGSIKREEVEDWVKEGIIEWPGHVEDVRQWISQASVFVLPSFYREGVPRSIQEAMAMGRPVITTDAPGCRETVIDGINGFLVPVQDVEALAQAMERFIQKPELIEKMGKESRRIAEERFDVHKINARFLRELGL